MNQPEENKIIIDGQTYYGGLNQPNLKFIKVNVDCWERIFDLLSLRDILAMSQTCQRMRQIGGHYFRESFHGTTCELKKLLDISIDDKPMERNDFLRFVDTLEISFRSEKLEHLRTISRMDLLGSLTTLRLWKIVLNECRLHCLDNIKAYIETIILHHCCIEDGSVGEFLATCPKLNCLRMNNVDFETTAAKDSLFQRTYPTLEYFQWTVDYNHPDYNYKCKDTTLSAALFAVQNPSVKCLRVVSFNLYGIPHNSYTLKTDCLIIEIDYDEHHVIELANQLKDMYANGCYKTLRVKMWTNQPDQDAFINEMASFSALEALNSCCLANICHLIGLKELVFWVNEEQDVDLESIARNLVNLEQLWIRGRSNHLLPFLHYSKRLKIIILDDFNNPRETLNLFSMNEARKMSKVQRKIRIGVNRKQYLATKWKGNNLNYDLVEITRAETIQEHFDYFGFNIYTFSN